MSNYIKLISKDGKKYYIDQRVAEQSEYLKKEMMNTNSIYLNMIESNVLDIVVGYLNHKYYYEKVEDIDKAKDYPISSNLALDVLKASLFLEC